MQLQAITCQSIFSKSQSQYLPLHRHRQLKLNLSESPEGRIILTQMRSTLITRPIGSRHCGLNQRAGYMQSSASTLIQTIRPSGYQTYGRNLALKHHITSPRPASRTTYVRPPIEQHLHQTHSRQMVFLAPAITSRSTTSCTIR